MEWKVRQFVFIILKHALVFKYLGKLKIDGEMSIEFG